VQDDHAVGVVDAVVGLGIRGGRAEHELDVRCGGAGREGQDRTGLGDALATDVLEHDARLAGRHPERLGRRPHLEAAVRHGSHQRFFTCVVRSPA
jgi:hypothetical protein